MLDIDLIKKLSEKYEIPMEDSVFIALNTTGVDYDCGYDRMRGQLHVTNTNLFPLAVNENESYFYFALPVHKDSLRYWSSAFFLMKYCPFGNRLV